MQERSEGNLEKEKEIFNTYGIAMKKLELIKKEDSSLHKIEIQISQSVSNYEVNKLHRKKQLIQLTKHVKITRIVIFTEAYFSTSNASTNLFHIFIQGVQPDNICRGIQKGGFSPILSYSFLLQETINHVAQKFIKLIELLLQVIYIQTLFPKIVFHFFLLSHQKNRHANCKQQSSTICEKLKRREFPNQLRPAIQKQQKKLNCFPILQVWKWPCMQMLVKRRKKKIVSNENERLRMKGIHAQSISEWFLCATRERR